MLAHVVLQVRKTSKEAAVNSTVGVLALNVLGAGGIGDSWQTGGLNASTRVECIADAPAPCLAGGCGSVWMQSDECAVLNATHVSVIGKALSPAVALLHLSVAARTLRERLYSFALHVPVWNGSGWQFASIGWRLEVQAVADAQRSEVRVGREYEASPPGDVAFEANHLEQLVVTIAARDADGAPINRTGERITVCFVSAQGTTPVELARFDAASAVYVVRATIPQPGEYVLLLGTDANAAEPSTARVLVVCAMGYTEIESVCSEEVSKQQLIVGGTIGGMFLLVGAVGIYLLRKHRAHARRFILSFLKVEALLTFKVGVELCRRYRSLGPSPYLVCGALM